MTALGLLGLILVGCYVDNKNHTVVSCDTATTCPDDKPLCENSVCAACTSTMAGACKDTTPVCKVGDSPSANTCASCSAHMDCASAACLPTGACGTDSNVAYVIAGGSGSACSKAMPCDLATALAAGRPYLKLSGMVPGNASVTSGKLIFLADPGAQLRGAAANSPVISVTGTGDVEVYDLELTNGQGSSDGHGLLVNGNAARALLQRGKAVQNGAFGVAATGGGKITLRQSVLRANNAGGLKVDGSSFDVTNNFIYGNGGGSTTVGGVTLVDIRSSGNVFEFNTVTQNVGSGGSILGVACAMIQNPMPLTNNIIYGNLVSGGGNQVGGAPNCQHTYSLIGPDPVAGAGNLADNPKFLADFHLQADSPARAAAVDSATQTVDFDGQPRPQPTSTRRDLGADEVP